MEQIRATKVVPLDGFRLLLEFNDRSGGVVDLSGLLIGPLAALRDPDRFQLAHVEHGAVVWDDEFDLAPEYLHALVSRLPPPKTAEDVVANQVTVGLRQLRSASGLSQLAIAAAMGVGQGDVSRLERRADARLSTLDRYVRALGGSLEIVVRLRDRSFRLGLGEEDSDG
jgi:hypothetical protein